MEAQRTGNARANALTRGELSARVEEPCGAAVDQVYDVLSDLETHAIWGGDRQSEGTRILSLQAPAGTASVGTEFETEGADPMGSFRDRSVVTEATGPSTFEFVTEATLEGKKGRCSDWTVIHRYELTPADGGSQIAYTIRITRVSELLGLLKVFGIPVLSRLAMKASTGMARRGVRNLARMAEERATAR